MKLTYTLRLVNASMLLTVSQLAKRIGVNPSAVRYYVTKGLITPTVITSSKYRKFDESELAKAQMVKKLRDQRYTLDEIGKIMNSWEEEL